MPEGKLYLVGTPIGNLGDLSPRAVRTLESVDFIAAEDTRVTLKLLTHFEIKKPLLSYNEHNRIECGPRILARLLAGECCALVTDAGMPAISDPGADMVCLCAGSGVETVVVPGPCAAVSALALSALPTQRFCFEGFLSTANKSRVEHLESLRSERRTMIFYEAPHKLQRTLDDFLKYFGDRPLSLCRELTKVHEEVIRTTVSGAIERFAQTPPRGEFVLILAGAPEPEAPVFTREQAAALVAQYRAQGMPLKQAARKAAEDTGLSRNELYQLALSIQETGGEAEQ